MIADLAVALVAAVWVFIASASILAATAAVGIAVAGYWTTHLAIWTGRRIRHRRDVRRMAALPAPPPITNQQAVDDYWTIRRAWNQPTREEAKR